MSVSSRDSIWGSMLTFAYCFFSTWCWKNTGILWVHPNLVGNMAVFVARFGCPITTPNLLHFGLKFLFWKLSEDVRTRCCQRIWTTLHNQKPKYAIEQKKRPLLVKPIMDKNNCPYCFPGIYIYICDPCVIGFDYRWLQLCVLMTTDESLLWNNLENAMLIPGLNTP